MYKLIPTLLFSTILAGNINAQEPTNQNVTKLYIATFDRAPDKAGLNYWVNKSRLSVENIATSFFDQDETKALYPAETSTEDFIKSIYANLFKRDPDSAGASYWKKDLDNGVVNKSIFILAVVNGAKGDDAILLSNKTEVGLKFIESGSNDVNRAKSIMSKITKDDSTVNDALATIASLSSTNATDAKEEVKIPDLSVNTVTGTSTATGSTTTTPTTSGSTSTNSSGGSTSSKSTTKSDEVKTNLPTTSEDKKDTKENNKVNDDELLPTF